jgi:hypothetical protein
MKTLAIVLAAAAFATSAAAHEVWVERDGTGPARVYLGEPADPVPANGDPEFHRLQKPVVFTTDKTKPAPLSRAADHIAAQVDAAGDVRVFDDAVFQPWKGKGDALQGVVYYARAGRAETAAKLDFELVPMAANADTFIAMFRGKPLADADVTVISPDRSSKTLKTDAQGKVAVPTLGAGRYIVASSNTVEESAKLSGKDVSKVIHITTLTFVR